ncbi:MAG TPA: hypothetical protein VJT81_19930 [Burkholderiales bacterium]|nr:hypothetical protein [Burkholderiales bacterium]
MNNKFGLIGVSLLVALATLASCGGNGDEGTAGTPPANNGNGGGNLPARPNNVAGFVYVTNQLSSNISAYSIETASGTFSSTRGLTGGSWTIDLALTSSNGSRMTVAEHYEFPSGFIATEACRQTAEAFSRAVQNLIGKTVQSAEFAGLIR